MGTTVVLVAGATVVVVVVVVVAAVAGVVLVAVEKVVVESFADWPAAVALCTPEPHPDSNAATRTSWHDLARRHRLCLWGSTNHNPK